MCDSSPMRRPVAGAARGSKDRLREEELTSFGPGSGGIVRIPEAADAAHPAPVLVIAPERYGLVQHTVDVVERFAAAGWATISPDFYLGISETEAGRLPTLSDETVLRHIDAAMDHLRRDPRCDSECVVVFGVCRSGSWGLLAGAAHPEVRGVIMLYGGAGKKEFELSADRRREYADIIRASDAPILGIFGENDHTMSVDDVRRLRNEFEEAGRSYSMTIVPGMPHGWLNNTMPGRFRSEVAEQTWRQMTEFLEGIRSGSHVPAGHVQWSFESRISAEYDFASNERLE